MTSTGIEAVGGAHEDPAFAHHEVAALDDGDAHLPGEEAVLEVGAVVDAGGEEDDGGIVAPGARWRRALRRSSV
jgi:hypothetical protein